MYLNGSLFMGDIYSNIVISAPRLTLEDAWEAAELVRRQQVERKDEDGQRKER